MRCIVAASLLFAVAAAEPEPDGAIAEPARWIEPRGCASGSHRSRALPIVTEIEEAWQLAFEKVEAPPVHWDGIGYVVVRDGGKPFLVAFDVATGKERARRQLRDFLQGSPLLVWDNLAILQPDNEQITGYRLTGKSLESEWIFRGSADAHPLHPVVHDNEVYCLLGAFELARLRPGSSMPSWTVRAPVGAGAPAVYGGYVFVPSLGTPWKAQAPGGGVEMVSDVFLTVYRRSDGSEVTSRKICEARQGEPRIDLMVTRSKIYLGTERLLIAQSGYASHAVVPVGIGDGTVFLGEAPGLWTCEAPPAHHPTLGTLLLLGPETKSLDELIRSLKQRSERPARDGRAWCADKGGKASVLAQEGEQPECFRDHVAPTVLGEIVYFGSWAADVESGDILWRLPVKEVTCSPVPADGMVLVVDEGTTLRAFRGRGKR